MIAADASFINSAINWVMKLFGCSRCPPPRGSDLDCNSKRGIPMPENPQAFPASPLQDFAAFPQYGKAFVC